MKEKFMNVNLYVQNPEWKFQNYVKTKYYVQISKMINKILKRALCAKIFCCRVFWFSPSPGYKIELTLCIRRVFLFNLVTTFHLIRVRTITPETEVACFHGLRVYLIASAAGDWFDESVLIVRPRRHLILPLYLAEEKQTFYQLILADILSFRSISLKKRLSSWSYVRPRHHFVLQFHWKSN